jgi:tetratricopeptide (TPR) repeat protein
MLRSPRWRPSRRAVAAARAAALAVACGVAAANLLAAPAADGRARGGWFDQELRRFRTYPHLDRANHLIDAGRLAEARAELEESLRIDPGDPAARRAYVVLLHRLGDHEAVVAQAGLCLRDDPRTAIAWLYRGLARQALGEPAAAYEDLRTASTLPDLSPSERHVALASLADLALRLGHPAEALGFLDELPRSRQAYGEHVLRGTALAALGRLAPAAAAFRDAVGVAPGPQERLSARRQMAVVLAGQGDFAAASEAARAAVELAPGDTRLLAALGEYAARLGRDAEAVDWLDRALATNPGPDERGGLLLSMGYAYRRMGAPKRAEKAFLDAAAQGGVPRSRALVEAAQVVLTGGDAVRALDHLERAAAATSDGAARAALHERQGFLHQSLGQLDEAEAAFERALALAPRRAALHRALGQVLLASGKPGEAIAPLERSLELEDDPEAWRALGLAQASSGHPDDALASWRRALDGSAGPPERDAELLLEMAQLEAGRGRDAEAADLFLASFARRSSPVALAGAAESDAKAGRWREAKDANRRLLELDALAPAVRAEAWARLAYAHASGGELEEAAEAFAKAIAAGSDDGQMHQDLGILLYRLGRFTEAVEHFRRAYELRPTALSLVYLGRCEKARDRPGPAILSLEGALAAGEELDPETRQAAREELGYLYARIHEYERAARAFEAALSMGPDASIEARLGRMRRLLGRLEEARRTLESVPLDSLPPAEAAEVLDDLAAVHESEHRPAAAMEARARARELAPSAERDYRLGLLKQQARDLPGAITLLEAAVAADPARSSYRVALAYACEQAGRPQDSARLFEDVVSREPDYPGLSQELAYSLMRAARNEEATRWFERAIDAAALDALSSSGEAGEQAPTTYRLRREVAKLDNRWDVNAYFGLASAALPGVSEGFGGAAADSQSGLELAFRPPGIGLRADRIFQVFGRLLGANLSSSDPLAASSHHAGLGVRYKPFGRQNLYVWAERLFSLGENVHGSWLGRGLYSWDHGYEMQPGRRRWPYSYVLADVARFSGGGGTLLYGEARQGASWNHGDRLLLTPHLLAEGRRRTTTTGSDGAFALGAGVSVRLLFGEDHYHAPRSTFELRVYYKLGRSWIAGESASQNGWLVVAAAGL